MRREVRHVEKQKTISPEPLTTDLPAVKAQVIFPSSVPAYSPRLHDPWAHRLSRLETTALLSLQDRETTAVPLDRAAETRSILALQTVQMMHIAELQAQQQRLACRRTDCDGQKRLSGWPS